ncbi:MAG: hypothetical protein WAV09_02040 [Minisyncoccia bacterium]
MENNFVPLRRLSAIKPKHIWLAESGQQLVGTLGKREFEQFAAQLVYESQIAGSWEPHVLYERAHQDSIIGCMVGEGMVSETQVNGARWLYQLTSEAIGQIYRVQREAALAESEATIAQLRAKLRRAEEESTFSRIKRHLKGVFVPMSAGI